MSQFEQRMVGLLTAELGREPTGAEYDRFIAKRTPKFPSVPLPEPQHTPGSDCDHCCYDCCDCS